eukprot:TRINITY_DN24551_c0_g1_i1.p1 TRINITY_DN24551_c0_g1~~TRINITY_DN24551_c0_g1_i1.p1  ORF type:complete len:159 (-),score=42.97 TRINITY_DN24551_c0_g1_i1:508-984(-)
MSLNNRVQAELDKDNVGNMPEEEVKMDAIQRASTSLNNRVDAELDNEGNMPEEDDEVKMDVIQYDIIGTGKNASTSLKEILHQIKALQERLVPIEINNVPDPENLALERIIDQVLHEIPEYLPGKFILKTPQTNHSSVSRLAVHWMNGMEASPVRIQS